MEIRPAAQLPELGCSEAHPCVVLAFENQVVPAGQASDPSAMAPITFARSTADCPPVTNFDVRVEGEASGAPVLYNWAARRCTGAKPLVVDYTETSSDSGRADYLKKLVDVGLTSLAATPAELRRRRVSAVRVRAPRPDRGRGRVQHARRHDEPADHRPDAFAPLARPADQRHRPEHLLPGSRVQALNPKHTWPVNGASTPLIRAEANADTGSPRTGLRTTEAEAFLQGKDPDRSRSTPRSRTCKYPTASSRTAPSTMRTSRARVEYAGRDPRLLRARGPRTRRRSIPASYGFIGMVDLPTARRFNLPMAKLVNASGKAVAPTAAEHHRRVSMRWSRGAGGTLVANPRRRTRPRTRSSRSTTRWCRRRPTLKHHGACQDLLTWGVTEGQRACPRVSSVADALARRRRRSRRASRSPPVRRRRPRPRPPPRRHVADTVPTTCSGPIRRVVLLERRVFRRLVR